MKTYISHKTTVHVNDSIAKVTRVIDKAGVDCAAVLAENKVIGVVSRACLLGSSDSTQSIKNLVSENLLRVCCDASISEIMDRVMDSPAGVNNPNLILVDAEDTFLGLVPFITLLKLQRSYAQGQLDRMHQTIEEKDNLLERKGQEFDLLNLQFAEQKKMLTQLRTSRADFIKQYSHEAHTPMNGVLGMLELLSHTNLNDDQAEMLDSAQASGRSMLRLIKSVLDYTQIETGNFVSATKAFDPKKLLTTVVDSARIEAKQNELELICNIDLPDMQLRGDAERMSRAIENLIIQLLDRTTAGGVVLSAQAQRVSHEWQLEINLRSQGSGLDLPQLDYDLVGSMASDDSEDVGSLCTTITERVIAELRGTMEKVGDNSYDFGYRISVPFPSANAADADKQIARATAQASVANGSDCERLTQVLLVDDNNINLEVAKRLLARFNCSTHLARDGFEALEMLKSRNIDCIFLDCEMSGMSGHEVCQKIRAGECGADKANVLICALTAHVLNSSREWCFEVGMDEFIPKPVSMKALKHVLDKWEKQFDHQSHLSEALASCTVS